MTQSQLAFSNKKVGPFSIFAKPGFQAVMSATVHCKTRFSGSDGSNMSVQVQHARVIASVHVRHVHVTHGKR